MSEPSLGSSAFEAPPAPLVAEPSIIDTILNLDQFLSGEIRLAEKTARFCTRPEIEAELDDLEDELRLLVDANGVALSSDEGTLGEPPRYQVLAHAIADKRTEYAAAMRSIRMRQMPDDEWQAFKVKHKKALDSEDTSEKEEMYEELLVKSACAPRLTPDTLKALRARLGGPQMDNMIQKAWAVNTSSGVSVPKSPTSLAVLKRQQRATS